MKKSIVKYFLLSISATIVLAACEIDPLIKPAPKELPADNIEFNIPANWPNPVYNFPTNTNPLTREGFILGRKLFYDTKLSRDNTVSCGTCHQQFSAFANLDHDVSHGINGLLGTRNAPPLFNLNWHSNFMWDGGINHIEVQPLGPITNPIEMGETMNGVIAKLQNDASYPKMFKDAFGTETITTDLIFKAMTQFQGMLVSANSKYDQYKQGKTSLTTSEMNGLSLFEAKCSSCHTEPLFTNLEYINNGLYSTFKKDPGRATITQVAADSGKFKVPSLRNIAITSPYMHDGKIKTLDAVLDHYTSGVKNSSTLHPSLVGGIALTSQEKKDIIAFLKTLTDNTFINDARFKDPFAQ